MCSRGPTNAASRCMNSSGDITQVSGAVAPKGLKLQHDLPGSVGLYTFVGKRRAGDAAASLFQRLAIIGAAAHRLKAEAVDVGAQVLI